MEELPRLAQLRKDFGERIHTMTLNVDFDGDPETSISDLVNQTKKVLAAKNVDSQNLVSSDPLDDVFERYSIESFPTLLFFQNGELKEKLEGEFSFEHEVVPTVERFAN